MTAEPSSLAPARRDPSLALLESLIADALDPGYAAAAERRGARRTDVPSTSPRRTARLSSLVSVVIVALVLTIAVEQVRASAPAVSKRRNALVDRVNSAGRGVSRLEAQVRTTTADVDRLRRTALGATASAGPGAALDRLSLLAGLTAVVGPGVVVTVDDAALPSQSPDGGSDDLGRVLDVDLQEVVNGLWESGAQAVSINGHRITSLSAIRGAGSAVLVDYRPLARPYVVMAIGPTSLEHAFKSGTAGDDLADLHSGYGIRFDVQRHDEVTVPAATSVTLRSVRGAG